MKFTGAFAVFALPLIILSCQKNGDIAQQPKSEAVTMLNVAYGQDPLQNMDVYLPADRASATTKVCILIHGGSWTSGDKADFTQFSETLKTTLPGYAIFNINYRLYAGHNNRFPTQENDVNAAVQHIYNNAAQYLISNKYILLGASAGAHLAMLQGYKCNIPVKPKAIVSFFGPSDLPDMYDHPPFSNYFISYFLAQVIGKTPAQDAALYINASPVTFINNASGVPTILLHGGLDSLVNVFQSIAVKDKLTAAGITNQYVFYSSGGHGNWDNATNVDALGKIEAFVHANVN